MSSSIRIKKNEKPLPNREYGVKPKQYSLTHNFFDPAKSSPPNYFISILQERLENMELKRNKE